MDPKTFPNPSQFNPDRFIDEHGGFVPHPNVVPFGVGKRRCLGESLAKVELFIFFASMMHKFDVRTESANEKPSTKYRPGVTLSPLPFKARFVGRN
jgi:cytochrome P450